MNPQAGNHLMQTLNRSAQLIVNSFREIQILSSQFLKYSAEEEKRERDRNRAPVIHFEKECPYPEDQEKTKQTKYKHQEKKHEQRKQKQSPHKDRIHQKQPIKAPQYLNYRSQQDGVKITGKMLPRPNSNPTAEKQQNKYYNKKASKTPQPQTPPPPVLVARPKAPISAFLRFNKAHIDDVRRECPHMSQTDLVTVTGHMWKNLDPINKRKFEEEYARDKQRYEAQMFQFFRKNPNEKKSKNQLKRERMAAIAK